MSVCARRRPSRSAEIETLLQPDQADADSRLSRYEVDRPDQRPSRKTGEVTDTLTFAHATQTNSETQAIVPSRDVSVRGSEQTTRAAFFTDTHRIIADVETGPRRLVEVLRDVSRAHLDL